MVEPRLPIFTRFKHFTRKADGKLELHESIPTGGAGSGVFKPGGKLAMIDRQSIGEPVTARSGTAKPLVYRREDRTLYVRHSFRRSRLPARLPKMAN